MTNNDELALKLKAAAEKSVDNFDPNMFILTQEMVDLLAERDADKERIEFFKEQLSQLANFNPDWDKLEILREHMAALTAAQKRIAELEALTAEQDKRLVSYAAIAAKNAEARTVSVKLPDRHDEMFWSYTGDFKDEKYYTAVVTALDEAGIKLEVGQ